jgi:hypothetical protein
VKLCRVFELVLNSDGKFDGLLQVVIEMGEQVAHERMVLGQQGGGAWNGANIVQPRRNGLLRSLLFFSLKLFWLVLFSNRI